MQNNEMSMTSQEHAQQIAGMLLDAQRECRVDVERSSDPKAQALFETVAEVLGGTMKALNDYTGKTEPVWQGTTSQRKAPPMLSDLAVDVDASEPPPPIEKV